MAAQNPQEVASQAASQRKSEQVSRADADILRRGLSTFAELGYQATTVRELAKRLIEQQPGGAWQARARVRAVRVGQPSGYGPRHTGGYPRPGRDAAGSAVLLGPATGAAPGQPRLPSVGRR
jgi:hypothetical protein